MGKIREKLTGFIQMTEDGGLTRVGRGGDGETGMDSGDKVR